MKKKIGIILLVVQVIAILGGMTNGSVETMLAADSITEGAELLGFCLPGIIGIILLIRGKKKPE